MRWLDLVVVVWVGLSAWVGYQRGLVGQVLSLVGLAAGALAGSRIAPLVLSDGKASPWVPFASLIGAIIGAVVLQVLAGVASRTLRVAFLRGPLRLADSAGGVVVGAVIGIAVAWLGGVVALQIGEPSARRAVQGSTVLSSLVEAMPPSTVLAALARFDPLPLVAARPDTGLPSPDPVVRPTAGTDRASRSVVKIHGSACGLQVQGSGWVAAPGLVATNAHVVAGVDRPWVIDADGRATPAETVYLDARNDVALLSVARLALAPMRLARQTPDRDPVVLFGYPQDGELEATPGTAGRPRKMLTRDAYGKRMLFRTIVPLRALVRPGNSGGPVVDRKGRVVAMITAASKDGDGGFGVPAGEVERHLGGDLRPVDPGPCA